MRVSILTKAVLATVVAITIMGVLSGSFFIQHEIREHNAELDERVTGVLDTLAFNSEYPVLVGDQEAIIRLVQGVLTNRDVIYCRIVDQEGYVLYEAGYKKRPYREYSSVIYTTRAPQLSEETILGIPAKEKEAIGTVNLVAPLVGVQRNIKEIAVTMFVFVVAMILAGSSTVYAVFKATTGRPLNLLMEATERISLGDLNHRVPQQRADEIGTLAASFNRMTAALQESRSQLSAAQETMIRQEKLAALGKIAGVVGHEIRNPLGVISNAVFYLKAVQAGADDTVREYLEMIQAEVVHAERIVSDLLDFARTKIPNKDIIPVTGLVTQVIQKCAIPENIRVETDMPASPPPLYADPLQVGQVLSNIIKNAIEVMPDGGNLAIRTEEDRKTPFLRISVRDTGPGMSPETMSKLFQPLFTTKAKGLGLGLTVVKNLTEANGGRIEMESAVGEGTTFTVILPVHPAPEGA